MKKTNNVSKFAFKSTPALPKELWKFRPAVLLTRASLELERAFPFRHVCVRMTPQIGLNFFFSNYTSNDVEWEDLISHQWFDV